MEQKIATYSSVLAWEISWTEEPGGLQSMGSQKSQTQLRDSTTTTNILKRIESRDSNGYLYTYVHSSIIHNRQKLETTQISIEK